MRCSPASLPLAVMLMLTLAVLPAFADDKPKEENRGPGHDVVSEEALRKAVQATPTFDAMMAARSKPVAEERPAPESSLYSSSLILSDGENFTLIPVGSILSLPPKYRAHVLAKPEGNFTFWPNFLKRNTAWLAAKEVPLEMAKGDPKLAKAVLRDTALSTQVLVAVYKGGPITILEPAPDSADTGAAKGSTTPRP